MNIRIVKTPRGQVSTRFTTQEGKPVSGYTKAEDNLLDAVHPEDRGLLDDWLQTTDLAVPERSLEIRLRDDEGNFHWQLFSLAFSRLPNGTIMLEGTATDEDDYHSAARELVRLSGLYDMISQINQLLVRAKTKTQLYHDVCRVVVEVGGFRMAWIGTLDPLIEVLEPVARHGHEEGYLKSIPPISIHNNRLGLGPASNSIRDAKVRVNNLIDNTDDHNYDMYRREALRRGYHSSAALPLFTRGQLKAVLNIYHAEPHFFTDKVVKLLSELTANIAFGLGMIEVSRDQHRGPVDRAEVEARCREIIRDTHIGILMQGPGSEIIVWNNSALELLGLTEDQLMGRSSISPEWNCIHEDGSDFPGATHPVPEAIRTRKSVQGVVIGVFRPAKNDRVWLLADAFPKLDENGEVMYVMCYFNDVTRLRETRSSIGQQQINAQTSDRA